MRWLIMSHLIKIYTVCPLVFEFSIWYSFDLTNFWKFAESDKNFVPVLSVVKELNVEKKLEYENKLWCFGIFHPQWTLPIEFQMFGDILLLGINGSSGVYKITLLSFQFSLMLQLFPLALSWQRPKVDCNLITDWTKTLCVIPMDKLCVLLSIGAVSHSPIH